MNRAPDDLAAAFPVPPQVPFERTLHGVARSDPYAWMRNTESPAVVDHLRAERTYYEAAVRHTAPSARALADAIMARIPPTERGVTVDRVHRVYYTTRPTGRENGEIRRFRHQIATEPMVPGPDTDELVLDIDDLRGTSDYVDLGVCELSRDERRLAYSVDLDGDEVYELRFRDLDTGEDLPDVIARSSFSGAWDANGESFFYTVHDDAYRPFEVRRHVLGADPATDLVVFTEPDEQYEVTVRGCRSGRLIVISTENRDTTEQWLIDPADPSAPPRCVEPRRRGLEYRVEHAPYDDGGAPGDRLLVVTNHEAVEFRLMSAPTSSPGLAGWRELTPYDAEHRLERVDAFADFLVLTSRQDGRPQLRVISPEGQLLERHDPPRCGHIELAENPLWQTPSIVIERYSFVAPTVWSDVVIGDDASSVRHREEVPGYIADDYVVDSLNVRARDGAVVPVTLVHRRDVSLDGTAPCLMYGYGAYEAVFEPEFDPAIIALLDRGVVYASAHIRGGGELGRRWWLDGHLEHKHHTFEDYIDVAEALGTSIVDPHRIATRGLSAGGLLQAAVFSQRPDLWRAVVAEVPFVDVVTTMLDSSIPLTANEWDEWGDPSREAEFGWLLGYSPYDNLPPAGGRPDLLVTGAVHDPRVMVWEPTKWVAALRASDPDWAPRCLFRVDTGAGAHSGPSGRYARAEYEAEIYAWVLDRLGVG